MLIYERNALTFLLFHLPAPLISPPRIEVVLEKPTTSSLNPLLKLAGLRGSGGADKMLVASGAVSGDGHAQSPLSWKEKRSIRHLTDRS